MNLFLHDVAFAAFFIACGLAAAFLICGWRVSRLHLDVIELRNENKLLRERIRLVLRLNKALSRRQAIEIDEHTGEWSTEREPEPKL